MPGPMPKDQKLRQRRNKASTRAVLVASAAVTATGITYPELPARNGNEPWHPLAVRWWQDVWSSPLHAEFLRPDTGALFRLANLVDAYWKSGALKYAAEIRLLEREFGLTPLARRRLEWTVAQTEEQREPVRAARAKVIGNEDPREVLNQ